MKKPKGKHQEKPAAMAIADKAQWISKMINRTSKETGIAELPDGTTKIVSLNLDERFYVVRVRGGDYIIMQEDDNRRVEMVSDIAVRMALAKKIPYMTASEEQLQCRIISTGQLSSIIAYWAGSTEPIPYPALVGFKDDPRLVVGRVPFNPEPGRCPTWDELCSRMDDPVAFKSWIGSIFDLEARNQQYLWLYGSGNDGKGSLTRFLSDILGNACVAVNTTPGSDKFFTSRLFNKRLCVFPDMNAPRFAQSDLFKSLTGNDPIFVEFKGRNGFTTDMNCKYMITSNTMPNLSRASADMRRAVCVTVTSGVPSAGFEQRLAAEGPHFIHQCIETYNANRELDGRIRVGDNSALLDHITELDSENEFYFKLWFEESGGASGSPAEKLTQAMIITGWKDDRMRAFRKWLRDSKGIKPRTTRNGGTSFYGYPGWYVNRHSDATMSL